MRLKEVQFLFFVPLVCSTVSGAPQNSSGVNHFWLVQSWPNGFCSEYPCRSMSQSNRSQSTFLIHGLWPVNADGQTLKNEKYNGPRPPVITEGERTTFNIYLNHDHDLVVELEKYWRSLNGPNEKFWFHQWDKHGTAQKVFHQLPYFRRGLRLKRSIDLLKALNEKGVLPNGNSYPKDSYKIAIDAVLGQNRTILRCVWKNPNYLLKEIILCLDGKAETFVACNNEERKSENCLGVNVKFPSKVEK